MANAPITDSSIMGADAPRCDAAAHSDQAVAAPRLLFLGSRATAQDLAAILRHGALTGAAPWDLHTFTNQKHALQAIRMMPPQLVMAEIDGKPRSRVPFCEMVRSRLPKMALVAVGKTPPSPAVAWSGYLPLPLHAEEVLSLLAEMGQSNGDHILQHGPIRLNVATRTVFSINGQHHMTPKQCALLHLLMTRPGTVVSRSEIMRAIWETSYMEDTRTLDVHIRWLRERIEPDPSNPIYLVTVRGQGYRLQAA